MAYKRDNKYTIHGDYVMIDVSTRKFPDTFAIILTADINLVLDGGGRWFAQSVGSKQTYACRHRAIGPYKCALVYMHRHILSAKMVDHRDGNGLNNTRPNLRPTNASLNTHNSHGSRNRVSAFKGVYFRQDTKKWTARIKVDGINNNLGCFNTEEEAGAAYNAASLAMLGEFSHVHRKDSPCQ